MSNILVSKKRLPTSLKSCMNRNAGYREKDIMNKANFVVSGNKGRTLTFYKKHKSTGKYDHKKYDTCQFDLKKCRFTG